LLDYNFSINKTDKNKYLKMRPLKKIILPDAEIWQINADFEMGDFEKVSRYKE